MIGNLVSKIANIFNMMARCAAISLIAACSGGSTISFKNSDVRVIDGYTVKWADASAYGGRGPSGLTPLMFLVAPTQEGVGPADLEQRQRLAKAALESDSDCVWDRFDPALNERLTYGMGGADFTLYVWARC